MVIRQFIAFFNAMKNEIIKAKVVDYTHDGKGVIKYDNYPFFVKDTILDELVEFKVVKWKKKYGFGKVMSIVEQSKQRVSAICPYFNKCGGCQLQFMDYSLQKDFKLTKIYNTFNKQGITLNKLDFIENEEPFNYRNKLSIPLVKIDNIIYAGLYRENSNDIIPIDKCLIQEDMINNILAEVLVILNKYNVSIYDKTTCKNLLRQLVIRVSSSNNEALVGFVINKKEYNNELDGIIDNVSKIKGVSSVLINLNAENTNVILGKKSIVLKGSGYITDKINGLMFRISLNSFYQVNTKQMNNLYLKAIEMAKLEKNDVVFDAYCGVGTISTYIAKSVKKVVGVDIVASAIENANENMVLNNLNNLEFKCLDVNDYMKENKNIFDCIFLDPPRKGCSEEFLKMLVTFNPKKVVYIACDVATQARDVKYLVDNGYQIKDGCACDMFSQTYHIENIILLER